MESVETHSNLQLRVQFVVTLQCSGLFGHLKTVLTAKEIIADQFTLVVIAEVAISHCFCYPSDR